MFPTSQANQMSETAGTRSRFTVSSATKQFRRYAKSAEELKETEFQKVGALTLNTSKFIE